MTFRVVALGDSTVQGLEDPGPDGAYVGWADRFTQHLAKEQPSLSYANLAISGHTTGEVRATQLDRALQLQPDLVLVAAGVNDLLRPRLDRVGMRDNLLTMYRRLGESGARVLAFTMPDMSRVAPLSFLLRPRLEYLNNVVREARASYGITVVDFAAEPVAGHPALWHDDRLHANSEGHRRVAAALAEAIGLDVDDWRTDPPESVAAGRARIIGREIAWMAGHAAPWAWKHLTGRTSSHPAVCKRPELLPVGD